MAETACRPDAGDGQENALDAIDEAAALLIAARKAPIAGLPPHLRPRDLPAAMQIQRRVAAALGPIGGWKVGASGPDATPSCAPMPLSGIADSPATLPPGPLACAVEAEIAFRLLHDLPPRAAPYGRGEIIAAIGDAHAAIEWLAYRFVDPDTVDPLSKLADGSVHGGFVAGPPCAAWATVDFGRLAVTQDVAGAICHGVGNPVGDMLRLVQWLADEGAVWDGGLWGGQYVTCGSWTGATPIRPGEVATVRFDGFGEVRLSHDLGGMTLVE